MKHPPLVALALSTALIAIPTPANAKQAKSDDQISGVGEFWLGYSFLNTDTPAVTFLDDDSYFALGGDMRLNFPIEDGWSFQLDLIGESGFVDNSNDNYTGSILGGGHVSWRDPNEWLLGGFVGIGNGFNADNDTATAWLLGAEGQLYLNEWTFYGQLGYMDAYDVDIGADDAFRSAWFGRGVVRYFLGAEGKFEGELSYASGENDTDSDDMDVWGWGVRYERPVNSMDMNLFLAYEGNYYDSDGGPGDTHELTEHAIKLGVNVPFGVKGQKYVDRHGATLDLPMVTRWAAYGVDVLD